MQTPINPRCRRLNLEHFETLLQKEREHALREELHVKRLKAATRCALDTGVIQGFWEGAKGGVLHANRGHDDQSAETAQA